MKSPSSTSSSSIMAQKLNNRAASYIESGSPDRAILVLVKALKFTEKYESEEFRINHCTLDDCMRYTQKASLKRRRPSCENDESSHCGFVYRNPIRVSPQAIEEEQYMGPALPLIITFNLALAHHTRLIQDKKTNDRDAMNKVLRLYECAYRFQVQEANEMVASIPFTMIIANNLSQIHRAANNHSKHMKCLQHLLSTVMFLVDGQQTQDRTDLDMDGFLQNASSLILQGQCASAA